MIVGIDSFSSPYGGATEAKVERIWLPPRACVPAKAGTSLHRRSASGLRLQPALELTRGEPETLHPGHGHRVTLTAAPKHPTRTASIEKSLQHPWISPARQGPRDMTGNVQLYLTDAERTPFRMSAPLGGFGWGVKERISCGRIPTIPQGSSIVRPAPQEQTPPDPP